MKLAGPRSSLNRHHLQKNGYILMLLTTILLTASLRAQQPKYRNLVMEGGGVRGFAYAGALEILDSLGILQHIERVGGTSAGAIQATLLAVGYTPREIADLSLHVPLKRFNDGSWFFPTGIRRLRRQFGWYKGDHFQEWMAGLIGAKTGDPNISFRGLHEKRDSNQYRDLYITGTDLTWQQLRVFSYESFPDMRIQDAVRISMSIPLYYKPVMIDSVGNVYHDLPADVSIQVMADGGVLSNYPLFLFDSTRYLSGREDSSNRWQENPETLGLLMEVPSQVRYNLAHTGNGPLPIHRLQDYIQAIYRTVVDKSNPDGRAPYTLFRTIAIDNLDLSGRVRKLSSKTILRLLESGRQGARQFFAMRPVH